MKQNQSQLKFGTLAIHAGQSADATTGAVMTPVYQTSTYAQSSPGNIQATSTLVPTTPHAMFTKTASRLSKAANMVYPLVLAWPPFTLSQRC